MDLHFAVRGLLLLCPFSLLIMDDNLAFVYDQATRFSSFEYAFA